MGKGCYHLGEMKVAMIRLYCPECHRFAQFRTTRLLERFGPDMAMPSMLRELKPCNIGSGTSGPQCQLVYWDAMTAERRAEAVSRSGLPKNWSIQA
jgi:hypothetical protein